MNKDKANITISVQGDFTIGNDLVGRDKIINNIIVVGQLLDFADAQKILPSPTIAETNEKLAQAIATSFAERQGELQALSFVGEIMGDLIHSWVPTKPYVNPPYRDFVRQLPHHLVKKLKELRYWETYLERGYKIRSGPDALLMKTDVDIFPLHILQRIWKENRREDCDWGIVEYPEPSLLGSGSVSCYFARGDLSNQEHLKMVDLFLPENCTREDFQLLIIGLVLDIASLAVKSETDTKFLVQIARLLD